MNLRFLRILTVAAAVAALTACGGGHKNSSATTAASPAAAGSPAGMMSGGKHHGAGMTNGAMMGATAEPVPASLNCGSTEVVWVNERSHVYHYSSDPYYGRTKSGKYMCEADAMKEGDHASKSAKPK